MVSLRLLIFAVVVTVSLIPVVMFGLWPQSRALDNAVAEVAERHLLLARNLGSALTRYHRDLVSTFAYVARNKVSGHPMPGAEDLLQALSFRHVCVMNRRTGQVIGDLALEGLPCPDRVPEGRRVFFDRIAEENKVVMSGVMSAPDGSPALFLLQRFGDNIAVGAVATDYFIDLAKAVSFGQRGHAAIVDRNGRLLAHPNPDWAREQRDLSSVDPVRRMMNGETGVTTFYSPAIEQDMIAGFTSVPLAGWGVMIPQPFAELEAEAASVRDHTLLVILAGTALAIAASWLLSTLITRPIARFVEVTARLRDGHAGTRVNLDHRLTSRELVELEAAFNSMVATLENATEKESRLRREAEKADRLKSTFLANMSHEIRTPLNAILGFSEVIKGQLFGPDMARYSAYAEDIHQSGSLMLTLINDILDLSKIEAGHEAVDLSVIDLVSVSRHCVQMFRQQGMSRGVGLTVRASADKIFVRLDLRKTKQILLNLLSNAIKFTPPGGQVTVEISSDDDGTVNVAVKDTGIGIKEGDIDAVLQPFNQVEEHGAAREGTGLGLPLVKALVELHGGQFRLDSVYGQGTDAHIILPDVIVPQPDQ